MMIFEIFFKRSSLSFESSFVLWKLQSFKHTKKKLWLKAFKKMKTARLHKYTKNVKLVLSFSSWSYWHKFPFLPFNRILWGSPRHFRTKKNCLLLLGFLNRIRNNRTKRTRREPASMSSNFYILLRKIVKLCKLMNLRFRRMRPLLVS